MIGIYKIINTANGKYYIGSSINIDYRIKSHFKCLRGQYHKNTHLQNAFNKYGEKSFVSEIIEICNKEDLLKLETSHILSAESYKRKIGYNILINAEHSRLGIKHTQEAKDKISEAFKGKKLSKEHRDKVCQNLINGSLLTDEQKKRISNKNRRFNELDINNIIDLYKIGKTQREISNIYKCSKTTTNKLFKQLFESGTLKKRKNGV